MSMSELRRLSYDLGAGVTAFSAERNTDDATLGGSGSYAGFNVCFYTGDDAVHTALCAGRLAALDEMRDSVLVMPRQVHGSDVAVITADNRLEDNNRYDALVTAERGVALGINTADCVPVVLADAGAHVIGAAHAGWRGAVGGVIANTVAAMTALGADVSRILAALGPSICPDCFEVGEEVAVRFGPRFTLRAAAHPHGTSPRPRVDLRAYVAQQLVDAGVPLSQISGQPPRSRCTPGRWCSARRDGIDSARTLTVIALQ